MSLLILGLALFLGGHLFTRFRDARARLIARFGEGPYKLGYSALVAVGLALTIYGYGHAARIEVWSPPGWTRHVAITLMWPAFVLLVATYLPGHIRAKAKHPMVAAVKIWASGHLIANGDLASIVLFGTFLAYAVLARILLQRAERAEGPPPRPASWPYDVAALALGSAIYVLFGLYLHPILIGVPAFAL
jgi:uncharacterized membrane protein